MRVPLKWLGELVELPAGASADDVMAELVKVGLEEEGSHGGNISGPVVVGQVLSFDDQAQSNGKTIRWCQVQVAQPGDESVRGIVCGASNFAIGDKVVVSLPGAVLPGGFEIAARKTYGHVSDGMIASSKELGLGDEHAGILILSEIGLDPDIGLDAISLLGLDDSAAEVNVTPDRGYCLSMRGIAREYSHATGSKFTDPSSKIKLLSGSGFGLNVSDSMPIHGLDGCSQFVLLGISGIDANAKVPDWMATRLKLAGMRSISIVVDITNYVMLELGQPLHAYDQGKLVGGISVRRANRGEQIQTLDEKTRKLDAEDLLISDEQGPVGIAGVMGGARTEVGPQTTAVLIEAAIFDPISIARSARRHKLPSEASKRFERGVDSEISGAAASRAAELLIELAGGSLDGLGAQYLTEKLPVSIEMKLNYPTELVGVHYPPEQVVSTLEQIGCKVSVIGDSVSVTAPTWRPDIIHKTDLVEEVARLVGYDAIPARLPVAPPGRGLTPRQKLRRRVLSSLTGAGFVEVLNYPFASEDQNALMGMPDAVKLANPIQSEAAFMRTSLIPGLLAAAARNISRASTDVALIEEGSVFWKTQGSAVSSLPMGNERPSKDVLASLNASIPDQPRFISGVLAGDWTPQGPGQKSIPAGFAQALGAAELVFQQAGLALEIAQQEVIGLHPGRGAKIMASGVEAGFVGELHPDIAEETNLPRRVGIFEINLDVVFAAAPAILMARELGLMPAASQDLSLVVPVGVSAAEIRKTIVEGAGELLESAVLVDDYRGKGLEAGQKSLTFALLFRAPDRTLTQVEASAARDSAVQMANNKFGATLRG
ncbi:phenylalanine--tRNA ligase subunit beta [Aquiluna sp.]|nr:phenylalanine--tRNA ligase subunit beta [Aquiluna sp.]MDA8927452.1 phenylalanine--tRNA ligase subunit beta [Aquiluna sp.]